VHDPKKFKVGDEVRIVRKVASQTDGWSATWNERMDKTVGDGIIHKIDNVNKDYPSAGFRIGTWFYPSDSLELASAPKVEDSPKGDGHNVDAFSKGDKVTIVRKCESHCKDWDNHWATTMDKYVGNGEVHTVMRSIGMGVYLVGIPCIGWPSDALTLLVQGAKYDALVSKESSPIEVKSKGEVSMNLGVIKPNATNIGGVDSDTFTDDTLIKDIGNREAEIEVLNKNKAQPEKVKAKIKALQDDIAMLVKIIDGRPANPVK